MHAATPAKVPLNLVWRILEAPLSDRARLLWLWYRSYHVDERGVFPSDFTTATGLGWSPRKVQEARAELVVEGYLIVVPRGPKPPGYYPTLPEFESQADATQGSHSTATQPGLGSHDGSHTGSHESARLSIEAVEPGDPGEATGRAAAPVERRPMRPEEQAAADEFARRFPPPCQSGGQE